MIFWEYKWNLDNEKKMIDFARLIALKIFSVKMKFEQNTISLIWSKEVHIALLHENITKGTIMYFNWKGKRDYTVPDKDK